MTMLHPPSQLIAHGLLHRYGRLRLFGGLAFEARGGEAVAVTGANGSGKSTLLRILAGLLTPTDGEVTMTLGGEAVASAERPVRVGYVAPYLELYDGFTARENLQFIAQTRRLTEAEARIASVLARVGLAGREDDPLAAYSSGMRQRARIAQALLPEPAVLFLDEPGATLDGAGRALVETVVADHRAAGGLVLLATNDPYEVTLCDRAIEVA